VEWVRAQVFGKLVVVESLRRGNRVAEDLQFGIRKRRQEVAEQGDPFGRRPRLVFLNEIHDAGVSHCRGRPSRPPSALTSSSQILNASSPVLPTTANGQVISMLKPILIGSAA
jgi:hypothetical protein